MNRDKIINFLNAYLDSARIKDASQNGLQVEGKAVVKKIAFGVSASLELFKRAVSAKADMIVVHHGLFWGRSRPVAGPFKEKLGILLANGITLAAWHLPLDRHPAAGNNAQILKLLGAGGSEPFGSYDGVTIGVKGRFKKPARLSGIKDILRSELGSRPLSFNFGPARIKTLGIVSGGAERMFEQAVAEGLDLFITGEVSEFVQEYAREHKANFISAGHYNTEKPGVRALEKLLRKRFKVKTEFIDVPNPV
jgi:dinuclear metal center YbgI/SA1388 family protein